MRARPTRRIWRDEAEGDDHIILCVRCYENHYVVCDDCGRVVHQDDSQYDEGSDRTYCPYCASKHENNAIMSYNYKPEPIFYGSGNLFMGVELEIDRGGEFDENAKELLVIGNSPNQRIYCKHDGSLNEGFEIVSHPMTLDYHKDEMNWPQIFEKALGMGKKYSNYRWDDDEPDYWELPATSIEDCYSLPNIKTSHVHYLANEVKLTLT